MDFSLRIRKLQASTILSPKCGKQKIFVANALKNLTAQFHNLKNVTGNHKPIATSVPQHHYHRQRTHRTQLFYTIMEMIVAWYVLSTVFLPLAVWSPLYSHPLVIFPGLPIKMWWYVGASKISSVDYIGNNDDLDEPFVITGDATIPMVQPGPEGLDNTIYQHQVKHRDAALRTRQNPSSPDNRWNLSSNGRHSQETGRSLASKGQIDGANIQRHRSRRRPTFGGPIENVTVNVGREATLECLVDHLGKYKVGWLKAKDQTILALHHRVITHNSRIDVDHEDNRIWKLKIRQIQESDRGCYMCQINTEEMKKQIGCIDVLIPPDIDDVRTSSDVIVSENSDAKLQCIANGHPKPRIEWLREDKAQFSFYDGKQTDQTDRHGGEVLVMRKVQRYQMGAYLCIASNDVPPAVSKRVILNVNFAPEIHVPSQLYGVGPGHDVTISCYVQAFPTAINYWMKNEHEMLLDSPKYNVTEEEMSPYEFRMHLTIRDWQRDDEAQFSCISTNSLGKADGRIQSYTFVSGEDSDIGTNSTPDLGYSDTTYQINERNDRPEKGWKRKRPELLKNATETERKWIAKRERWDSQKKSSSEPRRNPKRGQRKLDGDINDKDSAAKFGSSYFVNNGTPQFISCSMLLCQFITIVCLVCL